MTDLEKSAAALCAYVEGRDDVWADLTKSEKVQYKEMVSVVLMAIREPSDVVVFAGHHAGLGNLVQAWPIQIDAILSEATD